MLKPVMQVSLSKGQSREGAFINRSLLTLGTVISKLSEGHAAHVPFRDSKLTRLLCSSLSGSGAKVAVIATITPASSQAEETHNTLKFATRAKKVRCSIPAWHALPAAAAVNAWARSAVVVQSMLRLVLGRFESRHASECLGRA